jgi:hypothetical protein
MTKQIVAFRNANVPINGYDNDPLLATHATHLQQTNTNVAYLFQIKLGTYIAVQPCKQCISRIPTTGVFDKHITCGYLSHSENGNFPIIDVYTKPVKKIIIGKVLFSEKKIGLTKSV